VAGHETTASQLAWAFERLSREPAVQRRLADELDHSESEEDLSATITEILRLRPVLPNAEPRLTKRPVEIGGYQYPAGVVLLARPISCITTQSCIRSRRHFRPSDSSTGSRAPTRGFRSAADDDVVSARASRSRR